MKKLAAHLCTAAALSLCWAAQSAAEEALRVALNIDSQPVRSALKDLGNQAGIQVLLRADNVSLNGMKTPQVSGEHTIKAALDELLAKPCRSYVETRIVLEPRRARHVALATSALAAVAGVSIAAELLVAVGERR